jgi:hypothetical protein
MHMRISPAGLQINRQSAPHSTVEGALEIALLRAGLIAPSNYVSLPMSPLLKDFPTDMRAKML